MSRMFSQESNLKSELMSKTAFIWDLDGTLIDSYAGIMEALELLYAEYDLEFNKPAVHTYVLEESVGSLLKCLSDRKKLDFDELLAFFNREQEARDGLITLLPYAREALQFTAEAGILNFIYTHKGATAQAVLERLEIAGYFTEVLTSQSGFERKPHPQAIHYLIDKYRLDKAQTYYIGDRKLDAAAAENAGIQSISLTQPDSAFNRKIEDLSEIATLFKKN